MESIIGEPVSADPAPILQFRSTLGKLGLVIRSQDRMGIVMVIFSA